MSVRLYTKNSMHLLTFLLPPPFSSKADLVVVGAYCYKCFLKNNLDAIVCLPLRKHSCFGEPLLKREEKGLLKCLQKGTEISFFSLSAEAHPVAAFTAFCFSFLIVPLYSGSFHSPILQMACVVLRAEGRDERSVLN